MDGADVALIGRPERVKIVICPYDSAWPRHFDVHAARVAEALGTRALRIAHIGSTSVPGLAAKPIVDMLLVVYDSANELDYLPDLEGAGYVLRLREPHFHEHRMFSTPEKNVHLHVQSAGSGEIDRYLLLRGLLRTDGDARAVYETEKRRLAVLDWPTSDDYAIAKTEVVESLLRRARAANVHIE